MYIETLSQLHQRLHREQRLLQLYAQAVSRSGICDFPALEAFAQAAYSQQQSSLGPDATEVTEAASPPAPIENQEPEANAAAVEEVKPELPEESETVRVLAPNSLIWLGSPREEARVTVAEPPSSVKECPPPAETATESADEQKKEDPGSEALVNAIHQREVHLLSLFIQEVKHTGECDYPAFRAFLVPSGPRIATCASAQSLGWVVESCQQHLEALNSHLSMAHQRLETLKSQPRSVAVVEEAHFHLRVSNQRLQVLLDQVQHSLQTATAILHPRDRSAIQQLLDRLRRAQRRCRRSLIWAGFGSRRCRCYQHNLAAQEACVTQCDLLLQLCRSTITPPALPTLQD